LAGRVELLRFRERDRLTPTDLGNRGSRDVSETIMSGHKGASGTPNRATDASMSSSQLKNTTKKTRDEPSAWHVKGVETALGR